MLAHIVANGGKCRAVKPLHFPITLRVIRLVIDIPRTNNGADFQKEPGNELAAVIGEARG